MGHTVIAGEHASHPPRRGISASSRDTSVSAALARLRRATGTAVAFSGRVNDRGMILDRFDGPVVGPLRGVQLDPGHGLGGRVAGQRRALSISDYVTSPAITHRYDGIIRAESLRAMAAAPVIVARRPVAVLYVALRDRQEQLDRLLEAVSYEARALEQEIAVADVLHRRHEAGPTVEDQVRRDRVARSHARLRVLAARLADDDVRTELLAAADLLADVPPVDPMRVPHLSGRELDVLALLSLGLSNREIGARLGIGLHTVKDHVSNVLAKLGAKRRMEAAGVARRLGLVP